MFHRGLILALLLVAGPAAAYDYGGKGTWQPDTDNREFAVLMHYTHQVFPDDCQDKKGQVSAWACARLPDRKDLTRGVEQTAPLCEVSLRWLTGAPTDAQLREVGRKVAPCLRGVWGSTTVARWPGWSMDLKKVVVRVDYGNPHRGTVFPGKYTRMVTVPGRPCTITIAPFDDGLDDDDVKAQRLGHEFLHCTRGRWHEKV